MKLGHAIYQGDIAVIPVAKSVEVPQGAKALKNISGRVVLAEGEVTGHFHSVDESCARIFAASGMGVLPKSGNYRAADKDDRVLVIDKPTTLTHDEHAPFDLEPGVYVVRRQVTLEAGDVRRVLD